MAPDNRIAILLNIPKIQRLFDDTIDVSGEIVVVVDGVADCVENLEGSQVVVGGYCGGFLFCAMEQVANFCAVL